MGFTVGITAKAENRINDKDEIPGPGFLTKGDTTEIAASASLGPCWGIGESLCSLYRSGARSIAKDD